MQAFARAFLFLVFAFFIGCESLGPPSVRKPPLPPNLSIEPVKGIKDVQSPQSEPLKAIPPKPPEIFPAKENLLGPNGTTVKSAPVVSGTASREGKYTLNFNEADLTEVSKTILEDALKTNYVISPKVTGKVTLQTTRPLADDELLPTLEMLLRLNGAVLIKDPAMFRIEPEAGAIVSASGAQVGAPGRLPPGYQLRVVPLRFVGVQEIKKILEPLMPPKAVVKLDTARNMLLLAGTSDELQSAVDTIQLFDVDFMRGMSVGLFPVSNVEPTLLAQEIDKIMGDTTKGPLAGVIRIFPIERLNAILAITPQARYLEEIQTWIGRLDRYNSRRSGGVHVYRLRNVDAIDLAKTLSNIFGTAPSASGSAGTSLRPGSQGSQIGEAYADANSVTNTASDQGSSTAGDLGMGASNGGLNSGPAQGSGTPGAGGGMNSGATGGMGSSMTSGSGMTSGSSGGSGFAAAGLGRSTAGAGHKSSTATTAGNAKIVADPSTNSLIITARAQEYQEIEAVIKELDVIPMQVLIDVTVAEVQLTDALQYGIKWYFQQGSGAESLFGKGALGSAVNNITNNPLAFHYSLVAAGGNVRMLLSAEADKGKVNVLSSPSVMVLNNQEAAIKVGNQVPILTGQYGNFTGGTTNAANNPVYSSYNSVQYRDTGVLLNVRPRVNAGGLVSMEIIQAVDDVASANSQGASGDAGSTINSPTITQRQIKSTVAVQSGDTLVLGGLIKENNEITKSGIPSLYEVPILGDLFGQTTMASKKNELVVLLTPRVVETRAKSREISNEFRRKLTGLYEDEPALPNDKAAHEVGVMP